MTDDRQALVLNAGSSSLKFRLVREGDENTRAAGTVERLSSVADHEAATRKVLADLSGERIDVVGHRVVHGGDVEHPLLIDDRVESRLEELTALAPLHNGVAHAAIRTARRALPDLPQIAVFDTTFHTTLPGHARTYALDAAVSARFGIRRYGFHGISYAFVSRRAAAFLERPIGELRMIVLHLGNGASAAAIDGGRSIDTSMGFTPVEGLVMGTRPGDLDPAILVHLQRAGGLSIDQIDDLLQHRSGLHGLTGHADMRDVLAAEAAGSATAALALEVYVHRLRHYIGAYAAELGGLDALVFTGGIGENSPVIRSRAVQRLGFLGIRIDARRNSSRASGPRAISPASSPVSVLVVPTDEELEIARNCFGALRSVAGTPARMDG